MPDLQRFSRRITPDERARMIGEPDFVESASEAVLDPRGVGVPIDRFEELFTAVRTRMRPSQWPDKAASDQWLAPLLHNGLRLSRTQAADRATWEWLAVTAADYVTWRWAGKADIVAEDRWRGPVHKQALARLWWGAELFRDGSDYEPVRKAFVNQDLPNSLLHRPLMRCRPLAVGLVTALLSNDRPPTSKEVNDLARAVNLATAGSSPEVETGFHRDDLAAYRRWLGEDIGPIEDWDGDVAGPRVAGLTEEARAAGVAIATRSQDYARSMQRPAD